MKNENLTGNNDSAKKSTDERTDVDLNGVAQITCEQNVTEQGAIEQNVTEQGDSGLTPDSELSIEKYLPEKRAKESFFSTRRMAKIALISAAAFLLSFFEFPILPAAPFLKLDFSNALIMLGGFIFGPVTGVIITLIKEALCLFKSSTGGIGELANFVITTSFIIVPTTIYRFKKGLPTVIITLIAGCALQCAAGLIMNRYVNFPLYMGGGAAAAFKQLWVYVLAFNAIKSVLISAVTLASYKSISKILRMF